MKKINCPNVAKNLFILLIVSLIFVRYFQSNVYALTSDNINFQGKIVRNDTGYEGLNVIPGSPACVVSGVGNDTCDFQVAYYTASSGGTLLLTETFTNVEIGQYDGVFELSLGSGSITTTGQCRDGTCNTPVEVISEYKDIYLELKFSPDGTNLTETFSRMPLEASPYAILSKYAEGANDAFKLSTSVSSQSQASPVTGMVYYNTTTSQLTIYNGTSWEGVKSSLWTDAGTFTYLTSTTDDLVLGASTVADSTFFFDMDGSSGSYLEIDDASNTNRLLTILSGGNVGIGTATPGAKLEVAGSSSTITNASGDLTISTGGLNGNILLSPHGTGKVLVSTVLGIKDTGATPTHYTYFQGGNQTADITYTLPTTSSTGLLKNTAGVLSWDTAVYITGLNWSQVTNGSGIYMDYRPNNTACAANQVLKYTTGTGWTCADDSSTGDNWGTQTVATNSTLTGNGTSGTPLGLALGNANTWTGLQTFRGILIDTATSTDDRISVNITAGGTDRFDGALTSADLTAARTWILPNAGGTIALTSDIPASDNYQYWRIQGDSGGPTNVVSNYLIDFEGAGGITTALTANKVTIGTTGVLEDISALTAPTVADQFIVSTGSGAFAYESGATVRTSLGATTVGSNLFTLANPSAITFLRVNADNSVSTLDAATFRTAIGAGTGNGSVTNVATGTGLTGGPITTTGTISLSYADTLASNALAANNTVFASTGILFEGSASDTYETLLTLTNPTADNTITLQDNSGIVPLGTAANTLFFTTTAATNVTLPTSGTLATTAQLHNAVTITGENYLSINGSQVITASDVSLTTNVTGTLGIANGGTNSTTYTSSQFLWYNGTSIVASGYDNSSFATSSHAHNWSQITNGSGIYMDYKPNNTACGASQVLKYTTGTGWTCADDNAGSGGDNWGTQTVVSDTLTLTGNGTSGTPLDFNYTNTLATNPAMAAGETTFGSTGLIFEGSTANAFEGLLTLVDPTADNTWTLPDATGTIALLTGVLEDLNTLGAPTVADQFIVSTGSGAFAYESGATVRTSLGANTVGSNLFTLANPSAVTFLRVNADNSVSTLDAATFRTAIGAGTGNGSVTNVATGTGLTGGPITTTGTISLSYSDTLASNALAANNTVFGSTGVLFEGSASDGFETLLTLTNPTADNTITLPNATGTISLGTGTTNHVAFWSGTNTLSSEQYLATSRGGLGANVTAAGGGELLYSTSTTAYGHLAAGTSGQILKSGATGAPTWNTAAALTKTDDTNVTVTLGGSPSTALVNAASITVGWIGQLGISRGGTNASTFTSNQFLWYNGTSIVASGYDQNSFSASTHAHNWSQITNGTSIYMDYKPNNIACGGGQVLKYTIGTGWTCSDDSTGSATAWDDIGDPDANSSIAHGAFDTEFTYNTFASGSAFKLSSTSTAGTGSTSSTMFEVAKSGANTNTGHTAYGIYTTVTNTNVTSGTNIAGYFSASGATTANYGLLVANGNVGVGMINPSNKFVVNTSAYSTIELQYGGVSVVDIFSNASSNIFIGLDSGSVISTGTGNIALGDNALSANTTGLSNTAIGHYALDSNVAKEGSTALGYQAMMYANSTATAGLSYNTAIGYQALTGSGIAANNTGTSNTAVGHQSMTANTSGSQNTALGVNTLNANTTGTQNVAIGQNALFTNVARRGSVAIGYEAMRYADSTATQELSANTAIGFSALRGSGVAANNTGIQNTAIGYGTLSDNTTGYNNVAIGVVALSQNSTGNQNIAIGNGALGPNVAKQGSVAIGNMAMGYADSTATGSLTYNTAIGYEALLGSTTYSNNTGTGNTVLGYQSGYAMTSGSNNTLLGYLAGDSLTSGGNNIMIGYNTDGTAGSSDQLNIGNSIYGNLSNDSISIGDSTLETGAMFAVGASSQFRVDSSGDLTRIKDVPYTWPSSNASGILANNGSGTLSWSTIASLGGVTGTGSGSATAGQITWWSGTSTITGENDFWWDATNNRLGIGTASPTASLDIAGASSTISNASGDITITPASNLLTLNGDFYLAGTDRKIYYDSTAKINVNGWDVWEMDGSGNQIYRPSMGLGTFKWQDRSSSTTYMMINSNGNVGIGTASPTALLSVGAVPVNSTSNVYQFGYGYAKTDTNLRRAGTLAQSNEASQPFAFYVSVIGAAADASRAAILQTGVEALNNSGNLLLQPYAGKVGIGTLSPVAPFDLFGVGVGNGEAAVIRRTGAGQLGLSFQQNGNSAFGIVNRSGGDLAFVPGYYEASAGTEAMRIVNSTGNVGINTTNPTGRFEVWGGSTTFYLRTSTATSGWFAETGGLTVKGDGNATTSVILATSGHAAVDDRYGIAILRQSDWEFKCGLAGACFADGGWNGAADYAEYFYTNNRQVNKGDLVSLIEEKSTTGAGSVEIASDLNKDKLIGVISTQPGFVGMLGEDITDTADSHLFGTEKNKYELVSMMGQVPVKVSTQNGPIELNTPISTSSLAGIGSKAVEAGYVVGHTIESFNPSQMSCIAVNSLADINWPEDETGTNKIKTCYLLPDGTYVGKVMAYIKHSWYDPSSTSTTENISIPGWYRIASLNSNTNDYGRFKINNTSVGSSQNLLISVDSMDTKENINVVSNFMSGDYNITKTRINIENGTKYLEIYLPNVNGNQIKVSIDGENGEWVSTSITQVIEETLTIKEYSLSGLLFGVSDMLQVEDTGLKVGGDLIASTTTANIGDTTSRWNDIYAKGAIRLGSGNGVEGAIRFNTESKRLELSNDGSTWVQLGDLGSQMVISPEYPGAILFADGSENLGKMTSDAIEENGTFKNYYEWISNKEVAQDYDILVRITLPNDFVSWKDDAIYLDYMTENSVSVENNSVDVTLIGSSGVDAQSLDHISTLPGAWERMSLKSVDINDCNTAGASCTLRLSLTSSMEYFVRVGDITLNYNRSL